MFDFLKKIFEYNISLQKKIEATKKDIEMNYDLSTIEGVILANTELFLCFNGLNKKEEEYLRTQFFTLKS
jgi:hypothetical protein